MDLATLQGLLGVSEKEKREAQGWGLLQGGLGILANNTNRRNGLPAISQGAMMGLQSYQDQIKQAKANKLQDFQTQQMLADFIRKQAQQKALQDDPNAPAEVKAGLIPYEDYWKLKNQPKELKEVKTLSYGGADVPVAIYKDGSFEPAKGYGIPSDVVLQDLGGKLVAVDKRNLKPGQSMSKTMTPAEMANIGLARERFSFDKTQAGKPQWDSTSQSWITAPTGMTPGSVTTVAGLPGKPLTEGQGKAGGFADRMNFAESILSNPKLADAQTPEKMASIFRSVPSIPFMKETGLGEYLANKAESPERQQVRQAQENWVRANLRMESGALIGPDEMTKEIENYFPKLGDSPEVIQQKAANRLVTEGAMRRQAGPSYKPPSMTDLAELARLELERRQGR